MLKISWTEIYQQRNYMREQKQKKRNLEKNCKKKINNTPIKIPMSFENYNRIYNGSKKLYGKSKTTISEINHGRHEL